MSWAQMSLGVLSTTPKSHKGAPCSGGGRICPQAEHCPLAPAMHCPEQSCTAAGSPVRLKGAMESSGSFLMAEQFKPQTACSSLNQYVHLSNGNYTNERLAGVSTRINGLQQLSTCLQHAGGGYQHARGWIRVVHNALFPFNNLLGCCLVQKKKKSSSLLHPWCLSCWVP